MLWKRLWTCRRGYVMIMTRQQAGKQRNSDSIPGTDKGVLSTPKRPDLLYGSLSRISSGKGRAFCCSKTAGTWWCRLLSSLRNRKQNHAPYCRIQYIFLWWNRQWLGNTGLRIVHRLRNKWTSPLMSDGPSFGPAPNRFHWNFKMRGVSFICW
jgi:hypothetical protein